VETSVWFLHIPMSVYHDEYAVVQQKIFQYQSHIDSIQEFLLWYQGEACL